MDTFLQSVNAQGTISVMAFLHLVFVSFIALFPPVNPIGSAFIVGPFFRGHSESTRRSAALTIASYCLAICLASALLGGYLFKLFGISVPVVQIAGGFLIARMGFGVLSKNEVADDHKPALSERTGASLQSLLFYPLAFPTTTGGGTISVLLALSANSYHEDKRIHAFNLLATSVACVVMCFVIFLCYYSAPMILERLKPSSYQVVNKLSGFLTFCVGIQILSNGIVGIYHSGLLR